MKWLLFALALGMALPVDAAVRYRSRSTLEMEHEGPRPSPMPSVGLDLKYWPVSYSAYDWGPSGSTSETGHGFHLALEWLAISARVGKLGIGFGLGAGAIRGMGSQLSVYLAEALASYRLDYVRDQLIVPFVKGGAGVTYLAQHNRPGLQNYQGWTFGGGLEIGLNRLESHSARMLDRGFGIRATFLVVEYMRNVPLNVRRTPDLSGEQWRVGIRFEI